MAVHFNFTLNDVDAMNFLMVLNNKHRAYDLEILQEKSEVIKETLRSHQEYLGRVINAVKGKKIIFEDSDDFNI